ncbi:hypothetical protein SAY86_026377 [Trapa natans]|uniref:Chaperonin-like RbcX protein 2, chloroplastic n=1 Tax=Trapa natans TaxID=22666 RepID=A0AAN7QEH4_TRANT|nr:hypothetical protein SAY86_026377 [Trapa natans]
MASAMVGSLSVVGSPAVDSNTCTCLCFDSPPIAMAACKSYSAGRRRVPRRPGSFELGSAFAGSRWQDWRLESRTVSGGAVWRLKRPGKGREGLVVTSELGGQYEDGFEDVQTQILNYFTLKAVRTVMNQLYEMNPTKYRWFYDFVGANNPGEGKRFIRKLVKENQDLGERVMITRLHLYGKWIKKCDHAQIYKEISEENLELMRERLIETVIWPTEDTNSEKDG